MYFICAAAPVTLSMKEQSHCDVAQGEEKVVASQTLSSLPLGGLAPFPFSKQQLQTLRGWAVGGYSGVRLQVMASVQVTAQHCIAAQGMSCQSASGDSTKVS